MKITVATPNEVCDGDVTGTIEEIRRQYGDEALGWTCDWGERLRVAHFLMVVSTSIIERIKDASGGGAP